MSSTEFFAQHAELNLPVEAEIIFITPSAALVAQLDALSDWRQEVVGSTSAKVCNILSWRLIMKYFLRSFSPFR